MKTGSIRYELLLQVIFSILRGIIQQEGDWTWKSMTFVYLSDQGLSDGQNLPRLFTYIEIQAGQSNILLSAWKTSRSDEDFQEE